MSTELTRSQELALCHLQSFWPDRTIELFRWDRGPIIESNPQLRIARVRPPNDELPWLYFSCGLRSPRLTTTELMELFVISPVESPRHVELLAMLSNFLTEYSIKVGKVIDIGRSWLSGSSCDHMVVSLPHPLGTKFEWCEEDDVRIRFLWLIPITRAEAEYADRAGAESLMRLFDRSDVDFLDKERSSILD
jgi:Suppressor of fused protein (SUFU)